MMVEGERTPAPTGDLLQIVILGAGFGGLVCARALGSHHLRVTIIDRHNLPPLRAAALHVAAAALSAADIDEPVREIVRRHENVDVNRRLERPIHR